MSTWVFIYRLSQHKYAVYNWYPYSADMAILTESYYRILDEDPTIFLRPILTIMSILAVFWVINKLIKDK